MTMIIRASTTVLVCCSACAAPLTPEVLEATLPPALLSAPVVLEVQVAYINHPLAGVAPCLPTENTPLQILPYEARLSVLGTQPKEVPREMRLQGLSEACWMPGADTRAIVLAILAENRLAPAFAFPSVGYYPVVEGMVEFPPFSGNRVPSAALIAMFRELTASPVDGSKRVAPRLLSPDSAVRVAAAALLCLLPPGDLPTTELLDCLEKEHDAAASQTPDDTPNRAQLLLLVITRGLPVLEDRLLRLLQEDCAGAAPVFDPSALSDLFVRKALALPAAARGSTLQALCTPVSLNVNGAPETRQIVFSLKGVSGDLTRQPGGDVTAALFDMASHPDRYTCASEASDLALLWRILAARDPQATRPLLQEYLGGRAVPAFRHPLSVTEEKLLRDSAEQLLGTLSP